VDSSALKTVLATPQSFTTRPVFSQEIRLLAPRAMAHAAHEHVPMGLGSTLDARCRVACNLYEPLSYWWSCSHG
jgi:hypothetical protein